MYGDFVAAKLTLSLAIEALRLLNEILASLEIAADDGDELLCVFTASPELHDRLCIFGAVAEDIEDDGSAEECHRDCPDALPVRQAALPAPPIRLGPPVLVQVSPTMTMVARRLCDPIELAPSGQDAGARGQGRAKPPRRPAVRIGDAPRTSPSKPAAAWGRDDIPMTRAENESQGVEMEYAKLTLTLGVIPATVAA